MTQILGIETSCDETAAAVVKDGEQVLSNIVASQHELHEEYRGVVPEIASRAHMEKILPVVQSALSHANLTMDQIDAVAVGNRPGLIGSLIVGLSAAKALAWMMQKPLIGIDHVKAHLYAACLDRQEISQPAHKQNYPALGLIVSGGHTSLYEVDSPIELKLLGRTIDDAVGEAFDKAAVILQLGYPGGPEIDRLAQGGNPEAHPFPRSLLQDDSLDFSFSGLKTSLLYTVRGKPRGRGKQTTFDRSADDLSTRQKADLAASFQAAIIDTLIIKIERAIHHLDDQNRHPVSLIIGGGVSANSLLRKHAAEFGGQHNLAVYIPQPSLCIDNAAMIAGLANVYLQAGIYDDLDLPAIATSK